MGQRVDRCEPASLGATSPHMRYLCVHCDHRFEHEGEDSPRCPKCMRRHGLERLDAERGTGRRPPRWALVAGAVGMVAVVAAAYAWWAHATPGAVSGEVPLAPLDASDLRDWLAHEKVEAGDMAGLLLADEAVEEMAEKATAGADDPVGKAEALVAHLAARGKKKAFVRWATSHPREGPIRTAPEVAAAVAEDGERHRLYPLELAALAVAGLRAMDVPAMVVEAWRFEGDRSPPDPSGHFGYYLVGVWPKGEPDANEAPALFDPYGARGDEPAEDGHRVLTDLEALGTAMTHQAVHALVHEGDTARALRLVEDALSLDPRSPDAHTVRGAVLLQTGGPQEGAREFESAAELRMDGPRRKNLAVLRIAQGEVDGAAAQIAEALQQYPEYADAHAMLAAVHLDEGETDRARSALETAEQLDPHLPNLPQLWAQYHLARGEADRAIQRAGEAVERRPHDWQTRLHAAQVYRAASDYDAMRREARKVLEMVPSSREPSMRRMIEQVLGPTALEEPDDEALAEGDPGVGGVLPDPQGLKLGSDSRLLEGGGGGGAAGGGEPGGGEPSLADEEGNLDLGSKGGGSGPLLLGGDPSKLKLRDPGLELELDMDD
ncbi:MAG: tetratricopeptide repeat protein [Myxococcota bacterium]